MKNFLVGAACLISLFGGALAAEYEYKDEEAADNVAAVAAYEAKVAQETARQAVVDQQTALTSEIEKDYKRYRRDVARYMPNAGSHDTVRYLDFLTKVQTSIIMPGAADGVNQEIHGILRSVLGYLPKLENANPRDLGVITKAFLTTQITSDLDTGWWNGGYAKEDPHYKAEESTLRDIMHVGSPQSQEQFIALVAISMVAREKLWNPRSTLDNLRTHVRYFWPGDLSRKDLDQRDLVIGKHITADLLQWIEEMENLLPIRRWYKQKLRDLQKKRPSAVVCKVIDPGLEQFLKPGDVLAYFLSSGSGNQCGFFSLFLNDDSDHGGSSARHVFFSLVARNLENPLIAQMFFSKYIDQDNAISMALDWAWNAQKNGQLDLDVNTTSIYFENLVPYIKQLRPEDRPGYKQLQTDVRAEIALVLQNYVYESQHVRVAAGQLYTEPQAAAKAVVDDKFDAQMRIQMARLVQYLFRRLGSEPFKAAIEEMCETLIDAGAFGGAEVAELTLRQTGRIITPFMAGSNSDPVDVIVSANQNLFGWVGEDALKNSCYDNHSTIAKFKAFAEKLMCRLNIEQLIEDIDAFPALIRTVVFLDIAGNANAASAWKHLDNCMLDYAFVDHEVLRYTKQIVAAIKVIKENLPVCQQYLFSNAQDNPEDVDINEQINLCIQGKDIDLLSKWLLKALGVIYDDDEDVLAATFVCVQAMSNINESLEAIGNIVDLTQERNEEIMQHVPSLGIRRGLTQQIQSTVAGLDEAFADIIGANTLQRQRIIDGLNLEQIIFDVASATQYEKGADPEKDRGTAIWWANQLKNTLVRYATPLAVAEYEGKKIYLMDVILATDTAGNNTARNTHLINLNGVHYEKLIPLKDASLTSVAKAQRHMTKYGLIPPILRLRKLKATS